MSYPKRQSALLKDNYTHFTHKVSLQVWSFTAYVKRVVLKPFVAAEEAAFILINCPQ